MSDSPTLIPLAEQQLARAALNRLSKPVREGKGRLLYLVGPAGCGKSVLIREFASDRPECRLITASEFAAQLAEASDNQSVAEFQNRFRSVDWLACEDLHALVGRPQSQQQLLLTIDDLLAHGHDVIVSSTQRPGTLEGYLPRLVNRFRGGTLIPISRPGPDSRAALLRYFARQQHLSLPRESISLLSESLSVTARELNGLITQLAKRVGPLKRGDIEELLLQEITPNQLSPAAVARAVARDFGVTLASLKSSRRSQALVLPRQCAMWLCRKLCLSSFPELGLLFQRRHSSVLHAVRRLETRLAKDPALRQRLARLEAGCR